MKKQTSINIFGAEQRLVFLGGASGGWGEKEVPKAEKPTEGNVCYVPGDTKAEGTRTVEAREERLLKTAKRYGLERIDETLENFQVTEKLKKEGEEAKAKINSVTTWDNRQTINRTVDDFERLATIETDKFPLTPAIARARAIRKIDVAVKAETDPSKAVLLAYDAGKVKALLGNAKTPEDVTKIMERFGVDAAAGVQKQEWTPDTLQKVTQDTTGIAPGGGQPAIEAAEVAATGAPALKAEKIRSPESKWRLMQQKYVGDGKLISFKDFYEAIGITQEADKSKASIIVEAVEKLQKKLVADGYADLKTDGIFGPITRNCVDAQNIGKSLTKQVEQLTAEEKAIKQRLQLAGKAKYKLGSKMTLIENLKIKRQRMAAQLEDTNNVEPEKYNKTAAELISIDEQLQKASDEKIKLERYLAKLGIPAADNQQDLAENNP